MARPIILKQTSEKFLMYAKSPPRPLTLRFLRFTELSKELRRLIWTFALEETSRIEVVYDSNREWVVCCGPQKYVHLFIKIYSKFLVFTVPVLGFLINGFVVFVGFVPPQPH